MCGFTQDKNDTFDWTRRRGATRSRSTGPSSDHSSGLGRLIKRKDEEIKKYLILQEQTKI